MKSTWVLLLLTLALEEAFSSQRGLITNLDNGELCLNSLQCKSGCCHRRSGLSLARCADKAAEFQECSRWHLTGIYYRCPCENGLSCEADRTIIGTITNTDYGICEDPARKLKVEEKH